MPGSWCDTIGMGCEHLGERDVLIEKLERDVIKWRDEADSRMESITGLTDRLGQDQAELVRLRKILREIDAEFRAYEPEREGEDSPFGEVWRLVKSGLPAEQSSETQPKDQG